MVNNVKSKKVVSKSKNQSQKRTSKVLIGTVGVGTLVAVGVGSYEIGTLTSQDIQDFEPVYTISSQELKSVKSKLSALTVRNYAINVMDYDSTTMPGWYDVDGDGCPTRYDILVRDILNEKVDEGDCRVESGTMFDYYTGNLIKYNRLVAGGGIDVDHVVAKGDAWMSGGHVWTGEKWKDYINDEDVLMATSAKVNRSKGDKNASEWLPPNENFWCKYVVRQVQIKDKYNLSVAADEKDVMMHVLNVNCNK